MKPFKIFSFILRISIVAAASEKRFKASFCMSLVSLGLSGFILNKKRHKVFDRGEPYSNYFYELKL